MPARKRHIWLCLALKPILQQSQKMPLHANSLIKTLFWTIIIGGGAAGKIWEMK